MTNRDELTGIPHKILEEAYRAGVSGEKERAGTFFHIDQATIYSKVNDIFKGKIELMDIKAALQKYSWLKDYMWKAIPRDQDEFTRKVSENFSGGYFMRIMPKAEITFPLQACLMIMQQNLEQRVHNIIIAEQESKANIITSCLQHSTVENATHLGISEIYIKRGAYLNFTMVHQWKEETNVRPRSATVLDDKGTFVSNYICLKPVRNLQMYPVAYCNGEYSKVSFNNILYGHKNSLLDVGSKAILNGNGSRAEMISRAITREGSKIIVRGLIDGNGHDCKGHLECKGLIIDDESFIQSIPELVARKKGVEITHEAAVGKISEKEIEYLMTRRLSRDQAISLIIRGFMDVRIMGLPESLSAELSRIVEFSAGA